MESFNLNIINIKWLYFSKRKWLNLKYNPLNDTKLRKKNARRSLENSFLSLSTKCPSNHIGRKILSESIYNLDVKTYDPKLATIYEKYIVHRILLKKCKTIGIFDCKLHGLKTKDISFVLKLNKNSIERTVIL